MGLDDILRAGLFDALGLEPIDDFVLDDRVSLG